MNVLLTCVGRRNYLAAFFKQALGPDGQVLACDSSADAPAFREADRSFVVPPVRHPKYFDVLKSLCVQHQVRLLVAVYDPELDELARRAPEFREIGTICVISSPRVIAIAQDKWKAFQFMRGSDIPTPATYRSLSDARQALTAGDIAFPLLIKPRWGVSSIGVEWIDNDRQLQLAYEWGQVQLRRTILAGLCQDDLGDAFIFQAAVRGNEYGMDIINDLDGRYTTTLPRRKLAMRAGNTDRAVTVSDPGLVRIGEKIGTRLGHIGPLDCDLIKTDAGFVVIDLNPRFGGGYPFSHLAGANVPAALIAWAAGREPNREWFTYCPDVTSAKYDELAIIGPAARSASVEDVNLLDCTSRKQTCGVETRDRGRME